MTSALLRRCGYSVVTAHDGFEALEKAVEIMPDVVLLDIGLPGIDGCEVARRLKQMPKFAQTVLIAISGYGRESDFARSKAAGMSYHLVKPIDFDKLTAILQDLQKLDTTHSSATVV